MLARDVSITLWGRKADEVSAAGRGHNPNDPEAPRGHDLHPPNTP